MQPQTPPEGAVKARFVKVVVTIEEDIQGKYGRTSAGESTLDIALPTKAHDIGDSTVEVVRTLMRSVNRHRGPIWVAPEEEPDDEVIGAALGDEPVQQGEDDDL